MTLLLTQTACGVLLGNIKPVDERSDSYGVADLTKQSPDWTRMRRSSGPAADANGTGLSDVAFQSKKTGAVISLNSACRATTQTKEEPLKELMNQLLLGINDVSFRADQDIEVQGIPALDTTIQGKMNSENVMLRSVVLRKNRCVYDLMYIARPETFAEYQETFSQFVASLRLKE
ncbi:MAG TPA: hypothetical protein DCS07_12115 [Bdellovibrionales bacterium]|nr:MAG: hypothetical protein A2Z97_07810 [Bdellovibrionales bacterium GWB1_52_6]OFZ04782.1 MAG: hypothetical protein A2X97_13750 [Bdellovibrionales bacterium GWA1_52_35]OFZ40342.1 MAG: hypothetical protein A2070_10490 [Bdellovibrionales bacterium GWC1_52_8]HAR43354.1 hypothetical protein [Bdellovibrionales bacterium]HCM39599.1 hypothetical protein [Bdellovibrionales bacterium]